MSAYYDRPVGEGVLHLQASYQRRGQEQTKFDPLATKIVGGVLTPNGPSVTFTIIPSSNNLDMALAYDLGRYEIGIFGKNLTDGVKVTHIGRATYFKIYQAGDRETVARPRTIGGRIKVKFWPLMRLPLCLAVALSLVSAAATAGVDAPELAAPGPYRVGLAHVTWIQPRQIDVLAIGRKTGAQPRLDRVLPIDIWYPGASAVGAAAVVYRGVLTGEDGKDVAFTAPGTAVSAAAATAGSFPIVIMAHGYGGTPVAMSWLAENLASKGYVVVGPHFNDPPITDGAKFVQVIVRRPLDIAFVTAEAQSRARRRVGVLATADPSRTVLIGYSMGGYGALATAGTTANLKAVVAISPAGRFGTAEAFAAHPLSAVAAPTLFIVGDRDTLVGYDPGVKGLFDREIHATRYLLTFENAGHSIGMNAAPNQMRSRLWDLDWWEDPVWRKDRVLAVELHFITAFLARYVKDEMDKTSFLDVPQVKSDQGVWSKKANEAWGTYSSGAPPNTVWKGFQDRHAEGLELRFAPAAK